ncbi:RadC family protein [Pedobacter sp. KACC 23697]|uniref:JAB domain-containing protein n=1 Tax=Pedobacter sp. KACC 23697 TaxID=3149230 RepID=A0AAU7K6M3_9SPHI
MKTQHSLYNVSEIEIHYRNRLDPLHKVKVNRSEHANSILMANWDLNKIELLEQFKILLLDVCCDCYGISEISTGGKNHCVADPRIIFATALKANASSIILAHNHPSGNLIPSQADIKITDQLINAGKCLNIPIFDHIIVTQTGYYSFADKGLIPG